MGHKCLAKNWICKCTYKEEFQDMHCKKRDVFIIGAIRCLKSKYKTAVHYLFHFHSMPWPFHYMSYNISWHKCLRSRVLQLLPGSFSFLQQELQWCFALKFFIASSPRLAGPNTISYDLRNKVHINITCTCSLSTENFIILEVFLYPYLFSPAFITEGSVKFSPTPSDSRWRKS